MIENIYTTKMSAQKKMLQSRFSKIGFDAETGTYIVIERNAVKTVYSYLMQDVQVTEGDEVLRGQSIGKVGNTRTSNDSHLQFEVLIGGKAFNPELVS